MVVSSPSAEARKSAQFAARTKPVIPKAAPALVRHDMESLKWWLCELEACAARYLDEDAIVRLSKGMRREGNRLAVALVRYLNICKHWSVTLASLWRRVRMDQGSTMESDEHALTHTRAGSIRQNDEKKKRIPRPHGELL